MGRFAVVRSTERALVFGTVLALAASTVAFADQALVDNDIATPGNQNSVSLNASPGATVNTSASFVISWQGSKHLEAGSAVSIVDAGSPQTDLPAGYSVGSASGTVPSGTSWDDNGDDFSITSAISFTAPTTPGDYTYTVKFDPGTFTCESGTNPPGSCLNVVGGAFTINLSVTGCTTNWEVDDFLPPFDESSPTTLINNTMKNGRVVPVKVTIKDVCTGAYLTDPNAVVTVAVSKTAAPSSTDPVEAYADAGASNGNSPYLRWSNDGFWIYNLDSKGLGLSTGTSYRIDVYVGADKATTNLWGIVTPVK
jgi:hypothetical protein